MSPSLSENIDVSIDVHAHTGTAIANLRALDAEFRRLGRTIAKSFSTKTATLNFATSIGADAARIRDLAKSKVTAESVVTGAVRRSARAETDRTRSFMDGMRGQVAAMRQTLDFRQRMERQQRRESNQVIADMRDRMRTMRSTFAFESRMAHQRRREERDAVRRDRESNRDRRAAWMPLRRFAPNPVGTTQAARSIARTGTIATGAASAGSISAFASHMQADLAETKLKMFGGLSRAEIAKMRTNWGDSAAIKYGSRPQDMLAVTTEVLKAGIPKEALRAVTENVLKSATGLDLDEAATVKLAGRAATLTQDMRNFDPKFIAQMLNGIAVAAKETSADPDEIISSLRRGSGVIASSKMTMRELSAFTSSGISAGLEAHMAGTFMSFLTNEVINAKNTSGQRGKDLSQAFRMLGMGSRDQAGRAMANDPTKTLMTMLERMGSMDEMKRGEVADLLGMREWRDEVLTLVKVRDDIARTLKAITAQPNFLDEASAEKVNSLTGRWRSVTALATLFWQKIGAGLEGMFREITDFILSAGSKFDGNVLTKHVESFLAGILDGLGFKSWAEMLEAAFGDPSRARNYAREFFSTAKGIVEGVKNTASTLISIAKTVGSALGFDTSTAQGVAAFAGSVFVLSAALTLLAPVVGVVSTLAIGIASLVPVLARIAPQLKQFMGAGLKPGSTPGASSGSGIASAASRGIWGLVGTWLGQGLIDRVLGDGKLPREVADRLRSRSLMDIARDLMLSDDEVAAKYGIPTKPKPTDPKDRVRPSLEWHEVDPLLHRQNWSAPDSPSQMIRKASLTIEDSAMRIDETVKSFGSKVHLASLGGAGASSLKSVTLGGGSTGTFSPSPQMRDYSQSGRSVVDAFGLTRGGIIRRGAGASGGFGGNAAATAAGPFGRSGGAGGKGLFEALKRQGFSDVQAAALTGHAIQESNLNTRAFNASEGAHGLLQWRGNRWNNLQAFARSQGLDPHSMEAQAAFIKHEMANDPYERRMSESFRNSTTLEGASAALRKYIRFGDNSDATRLANARNVLNGGGGAVAVGSASQSGIGDLAGVPVKGAQATAGGAHAKALSLLAQEITTGGIAGGLTRFTGFNDRYHLGRNSKHNQGLATDFTIKDPRFSAQAAEDVRKKFRAAGLTDNMFKVYDEYKDPSGHATAGHIHAQFSNQAAAAMYERHVAMQREMTGKAQALAATALPAPGAWQIPQASNLVPALPTADDLARSVPSLTRSGLAGNSPGYGNTTNHVTVNAANLSGEEMAAAVQRRLAEQMSWRTHDVGYDL